MTEENWAPARIWLQRGVGEEGSHTWCEDQIGDEVEEAAYVRVEAVRSEREAFIAAYMAAKPASVAQAADVFDENWHGKQMWTAGIAYAHTALAANGLNLTAAARDVLAERKRQTDQEGWTPEHDDLYEDRELQRAAACYALGFGMRFSDGPVWPWSHTWWKPSTQRRNLEKAGALILAEIERLDRTAIVDTEVK